MDGYRRNQDGNFSGFSVQPLADMTGKMNLDDAAFFFGNEKNWQTKIGRFEAYDMFPLNQDTFIQYPAIPPTICTPTASAIST